MPSPVVDRGAGLRCGGLGGGGGGGELGQVVLQVLEAVVAGAGMPVAPHGDGAHVAAGLVVVDAGRADQPCEVEHRRSRRTSRAR